MSLFQFFLFEKNKKPYLALQPPIGYIMLSPLFFLWNIHNLFEFDDLVFALFFFG